METFVLGGISLKKVTRIAFKKIGQQYAVAVEYMNGNVVNLAVASWSDFISKITVIHDYKSKLFIWGLNSFIKEVKQASPEFYQEHPESIFNLLLEMGFSRELVTGHYVKDGIVISMQDDLVMIRHQTQKDKRHEIVYFGKIDINETEFLKRLLKSVL